MYTQSSRSPNSLGIFSVLPGEHAGEWTWESKAGNGVDHTDEIWQNQKPRLIKGLPATFANGHVEVVLVQTVGSLLVTIKSFE